MPNKVIDVKVTGSVVNLSNPVCFLEDQYTTTFDSIDEYKLYMLNPKITSFKWKDVDEEVLDIPLKPTSYKYLQGIIAFKSETFLAKSRDDIITFYGTPRPTGFKSIYQENNLRVSVVRIEDVKLDADDVLKELLRKKIILPAVDRDLFKAIFYAMAYAYWDSTSNYDMYKELFEELDLPESYRHFDLPLYRAMAFSKNAIAQLKSGKEINLKDRELTSWSKTKSRPVAVARQQRHRLSDTRVHGDDSLPLGMSSVILLKLDEHNLNKNYPTKAIINFYQFLKDPAAKMILGTPKLASEVLLDENGGFKTISKNDLIAVK